MHKKVLSGLALILSAALVASCSTESSKSNYYRSSADSNLVASPTAVVYSPSSVVIYTPEHLPNESYEVVTTIKVSRYNEFGIKRQEAQVNQLLKEQACSLGGNAVILIESSDKKYCYASVIQTKHTANNAVPSTSTSATNPKSATTPQSPS